MNITSTDYLFFSLFPVASQTIRLSKSEIVVDRHRILGHGGPVGDPDQEVDLVQGIAVQDREVEGMNE